MVMENNIPLVSFVVNCYNGELYLKNCISSILEQTYTNWEIIFWDNASTDNSAEIFNTYKDSRFKYFKSEVNVTLGQARAWAVNQCNGEYIAFLDVDDEWLPSKTEIQVTEMLKDDFVLSYTSMIEVDATTGAILVQATFPNTDFILKPGQYAKVVIMMSKVAGALLIPQRCIKEIQGQYSVFVVEEGNEVNTRQIKISERFDDMALVTDGLNAGDKIVIDAIQKVQSGLKVEPQIIKFESKSPLLD